LPAEVDLKLISLSSGEGPPFFQVLLPMRSPFDTCGNCFIITTTIPSGDPLVTAANEKEIRLSSQNCMSVVEPRENPTAAAAATSKTTTSQESLQFAIAQVEIYFDGKCDNAGPFIFTTLRTGTLGLRVASLASLAGISWQCPRIYCF